MSRAPSDPAALASAFSTMRQIIPTEPMAAPSEQIHTASNSVGQSRALLKREGGTGSVCAGLNE